MTVVQADSSSQQFRKLSIAQGKRIDRAHAVEHDPVLQILGQKDFRSGHARCGPNHCIPNLELVAFHKLQGRLGNKCCRPRRAFALIGLRLQCCVNQDIAIERCADRHCGASPYLSSSVILPTR